MKRPSTMRYLRIVAAVVAAPILFALSACGGGGGGGGNSDAAPPLVGVRLPQTGQANCYDNTAPPQSVACSTAGISPGQDGASQTGVAWPSPRFVVNDCGTPTNPEDDVVTDNLTGLIWLRNANLLAGNGGPTDTGARTWQESLVFVNLLSGTALCGISDWRLPNRKELRSLVNYGEGNSATWLTAQGFTNVQVDPFSYWSSSSVAGSAGSAWVLRMDAGFVFAGNKSTSNFVWPVRAGQ
jgi:hypothetical protein